jgi:hypothetical protein
MPSVLSDRQYGVLLTLGLVLVIVALGYLRRSLGRTSAAKLPQSLSLTQASFYDAIDSISNVASGTRNGCEYVVFDHDAVSTDLSYSQTVLAIRTASPVSPTSDLSRSSGLHFERIGEWVLVFEPHRAVEARKRDQFVDDCFNLLEYSRDVSPAARC